MSSSSAETAETMSYNAVCTTPFTRIHGYPTRHDYKTLKKVASDLASKVDNLTFAWSRDTTTGEEYGLLAEIIGKVDYTHLTKPSMDPRSGTRKIQPNHHKCHTIPHKEKNGGGMGGET